MYTKIFVSVCLYPYERKVEIIYNTLRVHHISKYTHPHFDLHVSISYIGIQIYIYMYTICIENTPENFPFPQIINPGSCVAKINISQRRGHRHLGFLRSGPFQRAEWLGQRREASGRLHESPPLIQTHEETADLGIFMMGKLGENYGGMWV